MVDLLGEFVRGGACAAAVREDEGGVEFDAFHGFDGLVEVVFGFAWEPADDVGGDADVGDFGAEAFDFGFVLGDCVAAVHEAKDSVAPALQGEVNVSFDFRVCGDDFDKAVREVFGVRGHEVYERL